MPDPAVPSDRIALGIIRRPHGVRGEASIEPWTDTPERFNELSTLFLVSPDEREIRPAEIVSCRTHTGRLLLHFKGIDSPEEVAPLKGWTLEIDRKDGRRLDEGEYFLHDLVGLQVTDSAGHVLGRVASTSEGGGGILLTISREGGRPDFDIPFVTSICTSIDLEAGRIVVDLPAGLDALDE